MKNRIAILFVLIAFSGFAQKVPGYLGKRFSIGYAANCSPALLNPNANGDDIGLNLTHELNLEFTIKRRTNLCLMYQFFNTGVGSPSVTVQGQDPYGYYAEYKYIYRGTKPFQLHTTCYGIGFKFFRKGTLAPVGKYGKLDLILYFSDLTYEKSNFVKNDVYNGTRELDQSVGSGEYNYKTFGLAYTLGSQRILFNCLVLDYGVRVAVLPAGALTFLAEREELISDTSSDYFSGCRRQTNYRLFGHQFLNVHIGLGFLAF